MQEFGWVLILLVDLELGIAYGKSARWPPHSLTLILMLWWPDSKIILRVLELPCCANMEGGW